MSAGEHNGGFKFQTSFTDVFTLKPNKMLQTVQPIYPGRCNELMQSFLIGK